MSGLEMMLKAAGFDPAQFQNFVRDMQTTLLKFNADLETIKNRQDIILSLLEECKNDA